MTEVEKGYTEPDRPFSRLELMQLRNDLDKHLRIGNVLAQHKKCKHWYRVRINGKKAKQISEEKVNDCGNCSICWKVNTVPKNMRQNTWGMVNEYLNVWKNDQDVLSHYAVNIESVFYRWLYEDTK
jgi:hypothetical protein